ncbi:MAG TPA: DUF1592 domain-containing protein, partial [Polyangiaceae bacterium]|nr:DUF1592 domain-containing protein [Polyangiaceae bacterium]
MLPALDAMVDSRGRWCFAQGLPHVRHGWKRRSTRNRELVGSLPKGDTSMPRSTTIGCLFALSLGLSACTGIVGGPSGSTQAGSSTSSATGGPPGSDPGGQGAGNNPALVVGHTPIRRLTSGELQNSLVDLLNVPAAVVAGLDADIPGPSGFSNDGSALSIGSIQLDQIMGVIDAALTSAFAAPGSPYLKCTGAQDSTCARTQLETFAARAYRRPLQPTEADDLMTVYTANQDAGFQTALSLAMTRVLLSPSFLYLTSFSGAPEKKGVRLSDPEFTSRLSYFLWSSVPDQRLLDLAANGTLRTPDVLRAEIQRMLSDPKSDRFVDDLFGQWLGFPQILDAQQVIRVGITDQLRTEFYEETRSFLRSIIADNKSPMTLLTANYTYLNADLATRYGVPGVTGTQFQRVSLAATPRVGLLSHGSILSVLSNPADSRPVARGHYILEQILCAPPPPPPANVNTMLPSSSPDGAVLTGRERLAQHRSAPSCAACHSAMDPLGLSEENFDQLGMYRATYAGGQPIDASGTLMGQSFSDFSGMAQILTKTPEVRNCIANKVLTYALNRVLTDGESGLPDQVAATAVQDTS